MNKHPSEGHNVIDFISFLEVPKDCIGTYASIIYDIGNKWFFPVDNNGTTRIYEVTDQRLYKRHKR